MARVSFVLFCILFLTSCVDRQPRIIAVNFEEPQYTIGQTIANIVNEDTKKSLLAAKSFDSSNVAAALVSGQADFAIIDNYHPSNAEIKTILPLFNQVLHLLVRDEIILEENTVRALLTNRKVYAGEPFSSTRRFVADLINDYDIDKASVSFVDVLNLFDADVIFSFTDLLSQDELKDLVEYKFYSFDKVFDLGQGSLVEGLCTRHPEFEPYIINRELYGNFTKEPIVTVTLKSFLVATANLPNEEVYKFLETLESSKGEISQLNPLLHNFTTDFDEEHLTFQLHQGSVQYLRRLEPVFIQKYADLFGVMISIIVAAGSLSYSFRQWKNTRKKNKIDVFYGKLMSIRAQITGIENAAELNLFLAELRAIQEETMQLVMKEKLNADESFLIFLSLSKIIHDELKEKSLVLG